MISRKTLFKKYKSIIDKDIPFKCDLCDKRKDKLLRIGDWLDMWANCAHVCEDCWLKVE